MAQTVLVIGATGNIGASAIHSALGCGFDVLAIVRNQTSAQKIFDFTGSKKGITVVEADILADDGVAKVVDQVRAGKLPRFQHVVASAGGAYDDAPLKDITPQRMREMMIQNFDSGFLGYRSTIPYLLEQGSTATFTLCTGAQGDMGYRGGPAATQGALYSLATAACRENAKTNIRFNEIYLGLRVEFDAIAEREGTTKASDFSRAWDFVFKDQSLRSSRILVNKPEDLDRLNAYSKIDKADGK